MTTIRVDCPVCCRIIDLRPDQVVIANYPLRRLLEFECPECETPMDRICPPKTRDVLLSVGVVETQGRLLPQSIVDMLRELRNSDTSIISTFECQLDSISTIDDIGWTA